MSPAADDEFPVTKERANPRELSEEDERAKEDESPVTEKRAINQESPIVGERATTIETAVAKERAINQESPKGKKRAVIPDESVIPERAAKPESPARVERAKPPESPVTEKRAAIQEPPEGRERAILTESPVTRERAIHSESSEGVERAATTESPESLERPLPALVILRDQIQKLRVAEGNRAGAYDKLEDPKRAEIHRTYEKRLAQLEDEIEHDVADEVSMHPAWPWLEGIRGVGPTSAALVLGNIDITRADSPSALWRFSGYGVTDGKRDRLTKGEKRPYNARLKTYVWRLIDLQVKHRGPFRKAYDDAKHRYMTTRMTEPDKWTLGHCEAAARRYAAKLFLSMLWRVWREAENLPVRDPWISEHGQGHTIIDPWEYIQKNGEKKQP